MSAPEVREGEFAGGLPYLAVGTGEPLVFLCGSTPNHRNAHPGLERTLTLRSVLPLARAGFEVFYTNRWPGMSPDVSFAEVAARHADGIAAHFGTPVDVFGHSTGGSVALQLIADRPEVVRRAVVASAAYTSGPVGKRLQLDLLHDVERLGRYSGSGVVGLVAARLPGPIRALLRPVGELAARRLTLENAEDTAAMLRAEDAFDVGDRLSSILTETLVVFGVRDPFSTLGMVAETAYRLPHGRLALYPDLGHDLVAAPRVVADVAAFLRA